MPLDWSNSYFIVNSWYWKQMYVRELLKISIAKIICCEFQLIMNISRFTLSLSDPDNSHVGERVYPANFIIND